jgi:hypothetical protein
MFKTSHAHPGRIELERSTIETSADPAEVVSHHPRLLMSSLGTILDDLGAIFSFL